MSEFDEGNFKMMKNCVALHEVKMLLNLMEINELISKIKGNSGSPLQSRHLKKFIQHGIVSRGSHYENIPTIITRISSYLEWIFDTVELENFL